MIELDIRMRGAVITLAQQRAEKIIKQEIRARGVRKVSQVKQSEIKQAAAAYLAKHPELFEQVMPVIEQLRAEGFFGKRAQLALERNSQDTFSAEVRG